MRTIQVIDSHTAGEPTRTIIAEGPDLGNGPLPDRLGVFRDKYDEFRKATVREPRGSDVLVGALMCEPHDSSCVAGVIFFNNVGYLGMCGHGMIGVVVTLAHLGRINAGEHRIDTPVGVVTAVLNKDGSVTIENVPSYRTAKDITVDVPGFGSVTGDVAWGGNHFFLTTDPKPDFESSSIAELQTLASKIRASVNQNGHPEVDHVELFGAPIHSDSDSRNFVLCPGLEYDRSPCGTGTSAKLACLAADGKLPPGEEWIQEGILGTAFRGSYVWEDESSGSIRPKVTGTAFVTAESKLLLNEDDPFRWGIE